MKLLVTKLIRYQNVSYQKSGISTIAQMNSKHYDILQLKVLPRNL